MNIFVLTAIFMILTSLKDAFMNVEGRSPLFISDLRIMSVAAGYLIFRMMYRKKTEAKQRGVRSCIEKREGVTAYYFYISELCWCDTSDADSVSTGAYLFAENILFDVSFDIFNSACLGDYFTAAVVDTGSEKLFYIVNYR